MADLAFQQAASGLKVEIAAPDVVNSLSSDAKGHGIRIVDIPLLSSLKGVTRAAQVLRAEDRRDPYNIIHVHTVKAMVVALLAGRRIRKKTVATLHNVHQRSSLIMLAAAAPVCISREHKRQICQAIPVVRDKLSVIHNGTVGSHRMSSLSSVTPVELEGLSLLYVGGLKRRKGVDLLLRNFDAVCRRLPEAHLYLLGNRDSPELEELAAGLPSKDNIHFMGFQSDPRRHMLASRALVVPSRREAFGLVVTDARSCSLPVIAANVDGLPEALSNGEAGILIDPLDSESWVDAMCRVLTDDDWRLSLSQRSEDGLENFTVERMSDQYSIVYGNLPYRG